jgi:cytochrome c oxidase subunit 2
LWGVLFGVMMFLAFALFAIAPTVRGWWLPMNVASYGGGIDGLFYLILAITGFFFVLTEAILVYCLFKYGEEPGRKVTYTHGHHQLEVIWTLVPGVILFILALVQVNVWAQVKYYKNMPGPDEKPLQMEVTARQWEWRVRYPSPDRLKRLESDEKAFKAFGMRPDEDDVHVVNEIHTWKGNKVLITLKTRDVLHSFFIPQVRIKQDALPGKAIPLWFDATRSNTAYQNGRWVDGINPDTGKADPDYIWELACAEFCGTRHSLMRGKLYVHPTKEDFLKWLEQAQREQRQAAPNATAKAGE